MHVQKSPTLGLAQICLAGVLWGTGGLAVQLIRRDEPLDPLTLSALRMLIGAAALLAVLAVLRGLPELARLVLRSPAQVVATGCGTAAYQALYFAAVTQVGVAVSTVVSLGLAPVLLAALGATARRRLPAGREVAVLAAALAGLVLVSAVTGHGETGPRPGLGVALAVGSGATYAVTTLVGRRLATRGRPLVLTTASTAVGAVALVPALAFVDGPLLPSTAGTTAWLVYLGVFTMAGAYGLFYAGLRTVSATAATTASLVEPVTAAVVAAAVLDERLGALGVVGTLLVLAAVAGLARTEPEAVPTEAITPDDGPGATPATTGLDDLTGSAADGERRG